MFKNERMIIHSFLILFILIFLIIWTVLFFTSHYHKGLNEKICKCKTATSLKPRVFNGTEITDRKCYFIFNCYKLII